MRNSGYVCFTAALLFAGALPLHASEFTVPLIGDKDGLWENYSQASQDFVSDLNRISGSLFVAGHKRYGLADADASKRLLYLATAGLAHTAFIHANSIVFGHEGAHFQAAHAGGLGGHEFRDHDDGSRISIGKAYLNALFTGRTQATAFSYSPDGMRLTAEQRMLANNAGLNWQMAYSEKQVRKDLLRGAGSVTGAFDMMVNRGYPFYYAVRDSMQDADDRGDVLEFEHHLRTEHGVRNAGDKIAAVSLAALIASPAYIEASKSFQSYVVSGQLTYHTHGIGKPYATKFTWDIPTYLNADNFSIAPTAYAILDREAAGKLGADAAVIGLGLETAVLGENDFEISVTGDFDFGFSSAEFEVASGGNGTYFSMSGTKYLTKNASFKVSFVHADGETMRGDRILPQGGDAVLAGIGFRF